MHELLLFAAVPASQHRELLEQLAGLTAMQPRHRLERRLVFKAFRQPGQVVSVPTGASQDVQGAELQRLNKMLNGGMYYTQVVGPVAERDFGSVGPEPMHKPDAAMSGVDDKLSAAAQHTYDYDQQPWKLEFRDIPEAGTRYAVTPRMMASASLPQGDVMPSMNAWGYE